MINFSNFCNPSIKVIRFACLIFAVFTFTNLEAQIDAKATKETKSLLQFLKQSSKNGTAFGYQTPTSMGRGWTSDNAKNLKSDMELATGYKPAIYGFDFKKWNFNLNKGWMTYLEQVKEIYRQGGIITYSWHAQNPITGKNSKDNEVGNLKNILIYPRESQSLNLAFDVTPSKYISGLITEKGVCKANKNEIVSLLKN